MRRNLVAKLLYPLDVRFVDSESSGSHFVSRFSTADPITLSRKTSLWSPRPFPSSLTRGEIFATASHYVAWELASETWALIVEDDALPVDFEVTVRLLNVFLTMPPDADFIFLGGGFPLLTVCPILRKDAIYSLVGNPATNTCLAYLARTACLKKMLRSDDLFTLAIDYELAFAISHLNFTAYHLNEYMFQEGSKSLYGSSLR
jgi:hypothetical protein